MRDQSSRRRQDLPPDLRVAKIAARQHGVIGLEQLRELGMGKMGVARRVAAGRLHPVHRGAYAVGHPPLSVEAELMAAVLALDPDAVLSHRSAAWLWGIVAWRGRRIDVTAPNRRGRAPAEIAAHRDGRLARDEVAEVKGIPCTTPSKTLVDLAGVASVDVLRRAVSEAEVLRLLDHARLRALIERHRGRRGIARLRTIVDEIHPDTKLTRSQMERLFLAMCARAGLPRPQVNRALEVEGHELVPDFLWRDAGLIVEADSRRFHDTDSAFASDRKREQRLMLAGWRVARCTWEQVEREPRRLARTIRALLEMPADGTIRSA